MNLSKAEKLAVDLMYKHDLFRSGWHFKFDNAKRRFGCCKYGSKQITLSKHLVELNSEAQVRNTILHEIAHALTPGQHHNHVWKRKAREIGCTGDRCYSSVEVETPEAMYIAVCQGCGFTHKRHKKPNTRRRSSCGQCSGGKFNPEYEIIYTLNPDY